MTPRFTAGESAPSGLTADMLMACENTVFFEVE